MFCSVGPGIDKEPYGRQQCFVSCVSTNGVTHVYLPQLALGRRLGLAWLLCYVTFRFVPLCYVFLRFVTLHCITLHYVTPHHIPSHHITSRPVTSCYVTLRPMARCSYKTEQKWSALARPGREIMSGGKTEPRNLIAGSYSTIDHLPHCNIRACVISHYPVEP